MEKGFRMNKTRNTTGDSANGTGAVRSPSYSNSYSSEEVWRNTGAWEIDPEAYQPDWPIEEKIRFWLHYAVLAPSAHNNQPWRCSIQGHQVHLSLDLRYTPRTGTLRQTMLSIGAFVENFALAAGHWGYAVRLTDVPLNSKREDKVAVLSVVEDSKQINPPLEESLFLAIPRRHTNRGLYDPAPLSPDFLRDLTGLALSSTVQLTTITESEVKERIAKLAARGVGIALSLAPLRRELADFVRFLSEKSDTGLLVESMVEPPQTGVSGREWTLNHLDAKYESNYSRKKYHETPMILLLSTSEEGSRAWLQTGRALQRILLLGAAYGYTHCITAAPIEIPPLVPLLKKTAGLRSRPQVLFRIGRPLNPAFTIPTPRRPAVTVTAPPS
jgi:nitroreductase